MQEHFFQCPSCWEEISMLLDTSISANYIEDCEVCCNPIEITTRFLDGELQEFSAISLDQ